MALVIIASSELPTGMTPALAASIALCRPIARGDVLVFVRQERDPDGDASVPDAVVPADALADPLAPIATDLRLYLREDGSNRAHVVDDQGVTVHEGSTLGCREWIARRERARG